MGQRNRRLMVGWIFFVTVGAQVGADYTITVEVERTRTVKVGESCYTDSWNDVEICVPEYGEESYTTTETYTVPDAVSEEELATMEEELEVLEEGDPTTEEAEAVLDEAPEEAADAAEAVAAVDGAAAAAAEEQTDALEAVTAETEAAESEPVGDPVRPATGALVRTVQDLGMPSFGLELAVSRHYDSSRADGGGLGPGWWLGLESRILVTYSPKQAELRAAAQAQLAALGALEADYSSPEERLLAAKSAVEAGPLAEVRESLSEVAASRRALEGALLSAPGWAQGELDEALATVGEAEAAALALEAELAAVVGELAGAAADPDVRAVADAVEGLRARAEAADYERRFAAAAQLANGGAWLGDGSGSAGSSDSPGAGSAGIAGGARAASGRGALLLIDEAGTPHRYELRGSPEDRHHLGWPRGYYGNGAATTPPDGAPGRLTLLAGGAYRLELPNGERRTYSRFGRLVSMEDRNGNEIALSYDGDGRLRSARDETGRAFLFRWVGRRIVQVTGPEEVAVHYAYDEAGRLAAVTDPAGDTVGYRYDGGGRLTRIRKPDGSAITYRYREIGGRYRATETCDEEGACERFTHQPGQRATTYRNPSGIVSTYRYDASSRTTRIDYPDGTREAFTYDRHGNLSTHRTIDGSLHRFSYDRWGRLLSYTDPAGHRLQRSYNRFGRPTMTRDRDGVTVTYGYDDSGNLLRMELADGTVRRYAYWENGLLRRAVDGRGYAREFAYDHYGGLTSVTDAEGVLAAFERDRLGRVLRHRDGTGAETVYRYRADGLVSELVDPAGERWRYTYSNRKDLIEIESPLGRSVRYRYDKRHLLLEEDDPRSGTVRYEYRGDRKLRRKIVAGAFRTEYEYGPRGRLVRSHQLESETEHRYAYDLQQRTLVHIQPDGTRVLTRYDSLGRAVRVERGEIVHDYSYTAAGRLLRVTDGTGRSSARRYDSRGRLRVVEDAAGERARFEYGPESRVVARQLRGRAPVEYRYSDRGLPTERREAGRLVERRRVDAAGRTVRLERPGAGSWRYRYTARGRMAEITRDAVPQWSAAYDRDGQPRSVTSPERGTRVYHYDERGRIDGVTHPYERSYRYRYNHRGMVTEVARPDGSVIRYAYDALGHRRSVTDPMGRITRLDLDWRGRLRVRRDPAGVTERFAYDAAGNLVRHDLHDQHHTIGYDAGGRVVSRATGGELLRGYSYDRAGRLSVTRDGSGGRTLYTYRAGRLAAVTDPRGVRRDFQYDRRGNLTRVRATTGEWRSYAHDSYGRLVEARTETNRLTVSYDGWGRPTRLLQHYGPGTRPLEVSYRYDRAGRISEYALQGIGVRTRFGYGEAGELLTVDTTGVGTVRFVRDALLRETERAYPDGTAVSSAYYLDGRLKARVARGRGGEPIYGQAYRYDEAGREELAVTLGGEVTSFGYDQAGRLAHVSYPYSQERVEAALQERAALGLHPETGLGAATLPGSTIADAPVMAPELLADARALARDTFPLQRSDPGDIRRRWSVSLRYDSAGNRAAKDTPLGTIHYRYDRWHRLTAIGRVRFSHDQAGNLTGVEGPRYGYRMGYTAWNRLSQVERRGVDPGLLSLGVGSVSAGATTGGEPLAGEGAAGAPGGQTRYRYDGLGRLVGLHYMEDGTPREDAQGIAGGSSGADAFTDPGSATFSEVYGFHGFSHQRLTTTTTRADSPLLAGGSLLRREPRRSGGDRALTGAAHLRRVPTDGQSGSAAGAGGSGAAAGAGGPDGRATLGAADTTLGARDTTLYRSCAAAPGAGTAHYAWKRPELYVRASANPAALLFGDCRSGRGFTDVAAFLQDRRGSVTAAVRDHRVHRFRYTVGGRPRSASTPEIGFSGAPVDPITGSYNYPYRSYLPVLGRFTSQDPIAAGLNWYSYAGNDPVNKLDLLGLLGSDIEMLGMGPEDIEPYPDLPLDIVETPVSSSDVGVSPQYFTQDTWAADFGEEFAASACAATSCLNEVSERYTMETGFALETELATDMLQAAVDAGSISSTHAYVNAWEDAANAMWGETGLGGGFVYSYESQPDHTVYAEDTDFDGVPDHFTNSTGPEQFYDPFNGELGSIEELQLQVGLPTRSFDFYD